MKSERPYWELAHQLPTLLGQTPGSQYLESQMFCAPAKGKIAPYLAISNEVDFFRFSKNFDFVGEDIKFGGNVSSFTAVRNLSQF